MWTTKHGYEGLRVMVGNWYAGIDSGYTKVVECKATRDTKDADTCFSFITG